MEIVWTAPARRDLQALLAYLAERSPQAARRVHGAIRDAVERLADFPLRGRPGRLEGTRELVIVGTPYLVVYRTRDTSVRILRVLHGARDWPPHDGEQPS